MVGFAASYVMTVALISNPVGWGVAIILGVGAAAASYGAGKVATKVYDMQFNEYDLVHMSGVDQICN